MNKIIAAFFAVIVLASASQIGFQSGSSIATLVRSQTGRYYGQYRLQCTGGQAPYNVQWNGLPAGWTQQNGVLNIPNIVNIANGQYTISARVTDAAGNLFNGNFILTINGINVRI